MRVDPELLADAAARARRYLETLDERAVAPDDAGRAALAGLDGPLPEGPSEARAVLARLDRHGSPGTVVNAGGRYFGFVNGGALPVTVAASWLAAAWDQNCGLEVASPVAARLEEIAGRWTLELLGLPAGAAVGFATGATMANLTGIAAARHALLARAGWDVETRGLFGAPEIRVVVGDEVHASLLKALMLVGFGRERVERVAVDGQGRMRADRLPALDARTLVCAQAGNVNSGAFDPLPEIAAAAAAAGAWLHVDGAFGLWVRAAPARAQLAAGIELADSWATDAHKWLNVPYDAGLAIVRDPEPLRAAMTSAAAYLLAGPHREPTQHVPEMSRRARGVEIWAALAALGRRGVGEMVERTCRHAARFAERLAAAGHRVLNEVAINQVLVDFGGAEATNRVIAAVQHDGTCWVGGTLWQGTTAMRISVSSWATTEDDVERSVDAILRAARDAGTS